MLRVHLEGLRRGLRNRLSPAVDKKGKDFLTEGKMKRLLEAAKDSSYGQRDYVMLLMAYRYGLKVSELVDSEAQGH